MSIEKLAQKAAGNWKNIKCFFWYGAPKDHPDDWALFYTSKRDSEDDELQNEAIVKEALKPYLDMPQDREYLLDARQERHNHWAFGYLDGYAIRVYRKGKITDAFRRFVAAAPQLKDVDLGLCYVIMQKGDPKRDRAS